LICFGWFKIAVEPIINSKKLGNHHHIKWQCSKLEGR
jgi:hypothetical protein